MDLDISDSQPVRIGEVEYIVGVVPLGKFEQLTAALGEAQRPWLKHRHTHAREIDGREQIDVEAVQACEECNRLYQAAQVASAPHYRELVRWGLRGWDHNPSPKTEAVTFAGVSYRVLPMALVERFARVPPVGLLVQLIGQAIQNANTLSEREALGFTSPSGA